MKKIYVLLVSITLLAMHGMAYCIKRNRTTFINPAKHAFKLGFCLRTNEEMKKCDESEKFKHNRMHNIREMKEENQAIKNSIYVPSFDNIFQWQLMQEQRKPRSPFYGYTPYSPDEITSDLRIGVKLLSLLKIKSEEGNKESTSTRFTETSSWPFNNENS